MRSLRTSERTTFKRCPQKWYWTYVDGLKPKGPPNKNMWFGTGVHLALAEYYKPGIIRGPDPRLTWSRFHEGEIQRIRVQPGCDQSWDSTPYVDAGVLGDSMLKAYTYIYGSDSDWKFICSEMPGTVIIPDENGDPLVRYFFTFDGVYRNMAEGGRLELLETKTTSVITTGHLEIDDQAGSYWALAASKLRKLGLLTPKEQIAGVNYNFLRKSISDFSRELDNKGRALNKPTKGQYIKAIMDLTQVHHFASSFSVADLNKLKIKELEIICSDNGIQVKGEISKAQPAANFMRFLVQRTSSERKAQIIRIAREAKHIKSMANGTLPVYKTPRGTGHDACHYGCEFYLMCLLHETGADWKTYKERMYDVISDPYAQYKKSTSE